jgi:hypothetical protein
VLEAAKRIATAERVRAEYGIGMVVGQLPGGGWAVRWASGGELAAIRLGRS